MGNNKRADQFARKTIYCSKNYLDLNGKDCAWELAERMRVYELFPIHSASMKAIS